MYSAREERVREWASKGAKQTQGGQVTELATASTENTSGCLVTRGIPKNTIWKYSERGKKEEFNCLPLVKVYS